jgi:DNA-binding MarR family transcriptional regulator
MKAEVLSDRQQATWHRYQRMRMRLAERLNRELTQHTGLSEADYEILMALLEHEGESVRALALRCGLEWEKSRLSHQLRRMEQRGLVVREACDEDNRGSVVRVTDLGRLRAKEAQACHEMAVRRYFLDVLTPEQLATLDDIADVVLAQLEQPHRP